MDQREKNRRKEHPDLTLIASRGVVHCLNGQPGNLYVCTCHPDNPWMGWFRV